MQTLIETRDGRKLDVLISGDMESKVALVCHHGTPSDSTLWNDWGGDALINNLRLVSISRPGYAFSDRNPGRSVSDVVEDVIDVLDEIGVEKFLAIGWSGGGPHALACAALLPSRCIAASILAGVGPHGEPDLDSISDMGPENIEHKKVTLQGESALREWAEVNATPWITIADEDLAGALGGLVPEIDVKALNEQEQAKIWASSIRRALNNGIDGYIDDSLLFCKDWGFRTENIKIPVTIWQGDLDLMVPLKHAEWLIKNIPKARSKLQYGHGHISLIAEKKNEIIDDLLSYL